MCARRRTPRARSIDLSLGVRTTAESTATPRCSSGLASPAIALRPTSASAGCARRRSGTRPRSPVRWKMRVADTPIPTRHAFCATDLMQEIKEELREESLVAAFPDHEAAVNAATALDAAGIPPDHVGVVAGNVRQAREAAGSFSAAGAIARAPLRAPHARLFVISSRDTLPTNHPPLVGRRPTPH